MRNSGTRIFELRISDRRRVTDALCQYDLNPLPPTTMVTPPTRRSILSLYSTMLRTSRSFSSYNFREYFLRRTRETFRALQVRLFFQGTN